MKKKAKTAETKKAKKNNEEIKEKKNNELKSANSKPLKKRIYKFMNFPHKKKKEKYLSLNHYDNEEYLKSEMKIMDNNMS